ncbi:MAG: hypothetical protein JOZ49_15030, partial [Mycolicibacterium sp.]|nr:hypothetical protein [Mycolicibacterium sp.]
VSPDIDAETNLRTEILEFIDAVRLAEKGIAAKRRGDEVPEELDVASLDSIAEAEWRAYWPPTAATAAAHGPSPVEVPEPSPEQHTDGHRPALDEGFPAEEFAADEDVPANGTAEEAVAATDGHANEVDPQ